MFTEIKVCEKHFGNFQICGSTKSFLNLLQVFPQLLIKLSPPTFLNSALFAISSAKQPLQQLKYWIITTTRNQAGPWLQVWGLPLYLFYIDLYLWLSCPLDEYNRATLFRCLWKNIFKNYADYKVLVPDINVTKMSMKCLWNIYEKHLQNLYWL